jgi:hypothetical protein
MPAQIAPRELRTSDRVSLTQTTVVCVYRIVQAEKKIRELMNEYRKRYEELLSRRLSGGERFKSFVIGFFGDGFGLVAVFGGIGGIFYSLGFLLDIGTERSWVNAVLLTSGYAFGSAVLIHLGVKFIRYCHRNLSMAVSGVREPDPSE